VDDVVFEVLAPDGVTVLPSDADAGAGDLHVVRTTLPTSGVHFVRVSGAGVATNYAFQPVRFRSSRRESEPNDTRPTADTLDAAGRGSGVVDPAGDVDFFRFEADAGELVTVAVHATRQVPPGSDGFRFLSGHGSTLQPAITAFDPAGGVVAESSYTPPVALCTTSESVTDGLPVAALTFVAPTAGTYTVEVRDELGGGSATATYVVERR
jgi:hypothetical protein